MIVVVFEAIPAPGKWDGYLDIAASLKPELSKIEGFVSIERFRSISHPEKVLSLSFWKDEESVAKWRNVELHRIAQQAGRKTVFDDYRLRIGSILRDYGMNERAQAPHDSQLIHK